MLKPAAYLAFDLGASSGRAILGSLSPEGVMEMEEVHRFLTPIREEGPRLYWDLDALWAELQTGLGHARARAPHLKSVSVDSWGVDYVPLGADGRPVRDAACYRDPRTRDMMDFAFARVPREEIYRATGIQFMAFNSIYQLLADREQEPELFARTRSRLLIADYFNHLFGGRPVAELSLASTTQLVDPFRRHWATQLIERLGLPTDAFPEIVPTGTRIGSVPGSEIAVIAGPSHDTAAAVAAVPAAGNTGGWAYLSCGTWSLLGVERAQPLVSDEAYAAGFTNEAGVNGTIRFLKNLTGLYVLQECERAWRESGERLTYDALIAEAEAAPSPARTLDLADPRFNLRGDMEAKLHAACRECGLPAPATRGELVRLILESMAEANRKALAELEAVIGERITLLHVVGGGSRNALLCCLTAQACGCTVVAGPSEATALGNLLVQAKAMGDLPDDMTMRDVVRRSVDLRTYSPEGVPAA